MRGEFYDPALNMRRRTSYLPLLSSHPVTFLPRFCNLSLLQVLLLYALTDQPFAAICKQKGSPLFGVVLRRFQAMDDDGLGCRTLPSALYICKLARWDRDGVDWHSPGRWGRPRGIFETSSRQHPLSHTLRIHGQGPPCSPEGAACSCRRLCPPSFRPCHPCHPCHPCRPCQESLAG